MEIRVKIQLVDFETDDHDDVHSVVVEEDWYYDDHSEPDLLEEVEQRVYNMIVRADEIENGL